MYDLLRYFRQNMQRLLLWIIITFVFFLITMLYGLPFTGAIYAVVLSFFVLLLYTVYDFYVFYQKYHLLESFEKEIAINIDKLPESKNNIERKYLQLIETIFENKQEFIQQEKKNQAEMINYYSLWVHQIKTPIAAMHLILQEEDTVQNRELDMELFHIEQYVDMALQFIRMNSSDTDYQLQEYSLDNIIRQTIRKFAPLFIRKKITVEYESISKNIITDEKWLQFALEQIISNALKYTSSGSVKIYLDSTDENVLIIKDTGIGIRKEDLPRIFEKGYTGFNGRMDKKATGIGLYLCKRILFNLSHSISISSEVGIGTTIKIDFTQYNLKTE